MKFHLSFELAELVPLIEHALAAPTHQLSMSERIDIFGTHEVQPNENEKAKPALWLVKDSGIYMTSNGIPHQPDESRPAPRRRCVYAAGYSENVYVAGDDFVEAIPIDEDLKTAAARSKAGTFRAGTQLVIDLDDDAMEVSIQFARSTGKRNGH